MHETLLHHRSPNRAVFQNRAPLSPPQQEPDATQGECSLSRKITRIYLAAPLFSEAERIFNRQLRDMLQSEDMGVYLPQEQGEGDIQQKPDERAQLFATHLTALHNADIVVAVCDGPDTDSGTAWEMGYAVACQKRVIALRTDRRMAGTDTPVNLMLALSAEIVTDTDQLLSLLCSSVSTP